MAIGHHLVVNKNGQIKTRPGTGGEFLTNLGLPTGCVLTKYRAYSAQFRRGRVIVGRILAIYRDDFNRAWRLGISDPTAAPTAAGSVTGGNITGIVIFYYNWRHKEGTTLVHQGNISPGATPITITNQEATITVPATAPDTRTTHVGVWASVDGDIPKYVTELTLGTTSYTWNGPVAGRGDTIPVNADGTINTGARGRPPNATIVVSYHSRCWYNSRTNPERWYYSLIEEPESVSPTAYIVTLQREAIAGAGIQGDQCVVLGAEVMYDVQGYSGGGSGFDFVMRHIADVGTISHGSICNVYKRLHFASKTGPYRYSGAGLPEPLCEDLIASQWASDYLANSRAYEDSQAIYDSEHSGWKLLIPGTPPFYWVVSYPLGKDQPPEVYFMDRGRNDNALGMLWGARLRRSDCYVGGSDGILRKENVYTNSNDDGDALSKRLIILMRHYLVQASGGHMHGGSFKTLTLYMKCDHQGYTLSFYGGDDPAAEADAPVWGPFAFGSLALASAVGETSKFIKLTKVSGKGVTPRLLVTAPIGFEWRGLSMDHVAGPQSRGLKA